MTLLRIVILSVAKDLVVRFFTYWFRMTIKKRINMTKCKREELA